ncbi:MAG: acyltransferase [Betaproteobacteria bacterium]|nr:acyltransferase [Betaproteobacteria bacterium]
MSAETKVDAILPTPRHLPSLDGLRGVAILLVLCHQFDRIQVTAATGPGVRIFDYALNVGWIGVQLFFVLSGFLITGILMDAKGCPNFIRNFYVRRALRIFPLYFGALMVFLVALPNLGLAPKSWGEVDFAYWVFLSNWFGGEALPHFWSLAVEEQFYFAWPFVVLALNARQVGAVCLALAVASLMARILMVGFGVSPDAIYQVTLSRLDALALGGAAAVLIRLPQGVLARLRDPAALWILALPSPRRASSSLVAIPGHPRSGKPSGTARSRCRSPSWCSPWPSGTAKGRNTPGRQASSATRCSAWPGNSASGCTFSTSRCTTC